MNIDDQISDYLMAAYGAPTKVFKKQKPVQYEEIRKAFYAGAGLVVNGLIQNAKAGENTSVNFLAGIDQQLREWAEKNKVRKKT